MESAPGRIEVGASAGSLPARKTHGDEHCERDSPFLYLPDCEHTSRTGNPGNPWQTRNRLNYCLPVTHVDYSHALIRRLRGKGGVARTNNGALRFADDAGRSLFRRCKVELPRPFLIEECAFSFVATAPMFVAARD